ncbi:Protein artemis [Talaromyces islandicus]|uniref:Protein artemis n=1 Tax=Talaromyces islandicus TaxID=28573 RepID=A0A0U1M5V9_TALIS|nr:Protein artemis [Talaromyces islandicus]
MNETPNQRVPVGAKPQRRSSLAAEWMANLTDLAGPGGGLAPGTPAYAITRSSRLQNVDLVLEGRRSSVQRLRRLRPSSSLLGRWRKETKRTSEGELDPEQGTLAAFEFDYFRKIPDQPAPLACFLSHVHSDHLQGLESLRSPFIYCSAVTKEVRFYGKQSSSLAESLQSKLLLRIEKYPHRMNFLKGILESRKQHYGHLEKLLRPIPLHTPTEIQLTPLQRIRVTLFDANHCAGAVMFLIEDQGKAILYTGDIRAEPWWVNSLTRNPALIPYACGLKKLDTIYLDTTFAVKSQIYRTFPSKSAGIQELLEKVKDYPQDTIFYLRAWTFGYEEVWQALSIALNSKIHVDRYQYGLYKSLAARSQNVPGLDAASFLCGYKLGNEFIPGCLTLDENVRIHSCEPGVFCSSIKSGKSVFITPVVTRDMVGADVPEIGAGGGKGDLYRSHELELPDETALQKLEEFLRKHVDDANMVSHGTETLRNAFKSGENKISLDEFGLSKDAEISLQDLVSGISKVREQPSNVSEKADTITFSYSRHSSYAELCELVSAFKPKDIFPCTVDRETWNESVSMESLFGHLCPAKHFAHDKHMLEAESDRLERENKRARYMLMRNAREHLQAMGDRVHFAIGQLPSDFNEVVNEQYQNSYQTTDSHHTCQEPFSDSDVVGTTSDHEADPSHIEETNMTPGNVESQQSLPESIPESMFQSQDTSNEEKVGDLSSTGAQSYSNRRRAYRAARTGTFDAWNEIALVSAGNNHTEEEVEL